MRNICLPPLAEWRIAKKKKTARIWHYFLSEAACKHCGLLCCCWALEKSIRDKSSSWVSSRHDTSQKTQPCCQIQRFLLDKIIKPFLIIWREMSNPRGVTLKLIRRFRGQLCCRVAWWWASISPTAYCAGLNGVIIGAGRHTAPAAHLRCARGYRWGLSSSMEVQMADSTQ